MWCVLALFSVLPEFDALLPLLGGQILARIKNLGAMSFSVPRSLLVALGFSPQFSNDRDAIWVHSLRGAFPWYGIVGAQGPDGISREDPLAPSMNVFVREVYAVRNPTRPAPPPSTITVYASALHAILPTLMHLAPPYALFAKGTLSTRPHAARGPDTTSPQSHRNLPGRGPTPALAHALFLSTLWLGVGRSRLVYVENEPLSAHARCEGVRRVAPSRSLLPFLIVASKKI
ncbi:hypothetical protein BC826DRAFT_972689 [Russula brevipes]|nr:hypothetical protein BC826DRAFT_972689 [Russula brevipes]